MERWPDLEAMGTRIMIMGLTNSGKSTLAVAIGEKIGVPAVHLDRLRHLPNTNWEVRADDEFKALHDAEILADGWVLDGNYSKLTPQRFERATGVVVMTDGLAKRYRRYFTRTLFQRSRQGGLEGGADRVNWMMINWLWTTRHSVGKYQKTARASGLPCVFINNQRELDALYSAWGLTLPSVA